MYALISLFRAPPWNRLIDTRSEADTRYKELVPASLPSGSAGFPLVRSARPPGASGGWTGVVQRIGEISDEADTSH